jgi:hypothetical protein
MFMQTANPAVPGLAPVHSVLTPIMLSQLMPALTQMLAYKTMVSIIIIAMEIT